MLCSEKQHAAGQNYDERQRVRTRHSFIIDTKALVAQSIEVWHQRLAHIQP